MIMHPCSRVAGLLFSFALVTWAEDPPAPAELEVYLLAGQSNMEGQAVVDLDHAEHYNGGRGILRTVLDEERGGGRWAHLRADDGTWSEREDVHVWYRNGHDELKAGPLSIGYAVYGGRHHFGPELMIGHALGDAHENPVLLIKTAWGGKSLMHDFRPPSAGGETGPYYARMLEEYRAGLAAAQERFASLAGREPRLRGVFWFQGWNDMVDGEAAAQYADNLAHLIGDLRGEFAAPELPVVVGETGNCDDLEFRAAQRAGCEREGVGEYVRFVETAGFRRPAQESPNVGHGHHWFGNAESYLLIGEALGRAMCELTDGSEGKAPR